MSSNSSEGEETPRPSHAVLDLTPCTPEELAKPHYKYNPYKVKQQITKQSNPNNKIHKTMHKQNNILNCYFFHVHMFIISFYLELKNVN